MITGEKYGIYGLIFDIFFIRHETSSKSHSSRISFNQYKSPFCSREQVLSIILPPDCESQPAVNAHTAHPIQSIQHISLAPSFFFLSGIFSLSKISRSEIRQQTTLDKIYRCVCDDESAFSLLVCRSTDALENIVLK